MKGHIFPTIKHPVKLPSISSLPKLNCIPQPKHKINFNQKPFISINYLAPLTQRNQLSPRHFKKIKESAQTYRLPSKSISIRTDITLQPPNHDIFELYIKKSEEIIHQRNLENSQYDLRHDRAIKEIINKSKAPPGKNLKKLMDLPNTPSEFEINPRNQYAISMKRSSIGGLGQTSSKFQIRKQNQAVVESSTNVKRYLNMSDEVVKDLSVEFDGILSEINQKNAKLQNQLANESAFHKSIMELNSALKADDLERVKKMLKEFPKLLSIHYSV
jgi:hypothetical protein